MVTIRWRDGRRVELLPRETVLDGLLRAGVHVAYHCKVGGCQTCLLRAVEGEPPRESWFGLAGPLREQGYFFSCICVPETDLSVTDQTPSEEPSADPT